MWRAGDQYFACAGEHGALVLPYHAATANAVLSPSADPVELMLNLKPEAMLVVTQDAQPLDSFNAGEDVHFANRQSLLRVDSPRMYQIAKNPDGRPHELRLDVTAPGLAVFAFSFSSCTAMPQG